MLKAHLPLFLMVILSAGLGGLLLALSNFLGPRRPSKIKMDVFECGNPPTGPARERFNVKFYLVAILFLVFDIEAVFVYPWAVTFSDSVHGKSAISPGLLAGTMFSFSASLVVALAYMWRKGALEWAGREDDELEEHAPVAAHGHHAAHASHAHDTSHIRAA